MSARIDVVLQCDKHPHVFVRCRVRDAESLTHAQMIGVAREQAANYGWSYEGTLKTRDLCPDCAPSFRR